MVVEMAAGMTVERRPGRAESRLSGIGKGPGHPLRAARAMLYGRLTSRSGMASCRRSSRR